MLSGDSMNTISAESIGLGSVVIVVVVGVVEVEGGVGSRPMPSGDGRIVIWRGDAGSVLCDGR